MVFRNENNERCGTVDYGVAQCSADVTYSDALIWGTSRKSGIEFADYFFASGAPQPGKRRKLYGSSQHTPDEILVFPTWKMISDDTATGN
jgi:hypothetical protein